MRLADRVDACWIVRPGDHNPELAYSLRSVAQNLPRNRAVIAGHTPPWVRNVITVGTSQDGDKHANALTNLRALLARDDLTPTVTIFNDDMFVMEPVDHAPVLHCGPLQGAADRRPYGSAPARAYTDTLLLLAGLGIRDPLCYDLHTPFTADRASLLATLDTVALLADDPPRILWKTVHGNLHAYPAGYMPDVKVIELDQPPRPGPFTSTIDLAFTHGVVGRHIRAAFPNPSRYEEH